MTTNYETMSFDTLSHHLSYPYSGFSYMVMLIL